MSQPRFANDETAKVTFHTDQNCSNLAALAPQKFEMSVSPSSGTVICPGLKSKSFSIDIHVTKRGAENEAYLQVKLELLEAPNPQNHWPQIIPILFPDDLMHLLFAFEGLNVPKMLECSAQVPT